MSPESLPPESLMRPLALDLFYFIWPMVVGVAAFFVGRFFHRWSIAVRAGLVGLTVGAILVVGATIFRVMPHPVDVGLSYVGGIITVLCWMSLGVIGISWATPNPSADVFFRIFLALVPLTLIGVESGGSLWFRFNQTSAWENVPNGGLVKQSTSMTCLPASASMLLAQYGIEDISEGELAYDANTTFFGTDAYAIARALSGKLEKRGARGVMGYLDFETCRELNRPFIAQVRLGQVGQHALLVKAIYNDYHIVCFDPLPDENRPGASPVKTLTRVEFEYIWSGGAIWIEGLDLLAEIEPAIQEKTPPKTPDVEPQP